MLFGVNIPLPDVVHEPEPVLEVPFKSTDALFAQTVTLLPALTTGWGVNITVIELFSGRQFPLLVEVSVSTTEPAAKSAALGIYVAFSVVGLGVKLPLPEVVQVPVPVLEYPFSETLGLFTHTESSGPASTRGAFVMVIIIWSVTARQFPFPVVVMVIVTVPAVVSAPLGM